MSINHIGKHSTKKQQELIRTIANKYSLPYNENRIKDFIYCRDWLNLHTKEIGGYNAPIRNVGMIVIALLLAFFLAYKF